jgi:acyl-phosphate glycerol 3-phosphate acyltransferase
VTHHLGPVLILVALGSFLVGSIPFGLIVGRAFYGSDIRGAFAAPMLPLPALRTYGRGAGIAVLVLDALKGALPTAIELHLAGDGAAATAALFTVLGHCYSPWLRYRGGKGVATWLGALCALSGLAGLTFAVVWLAVVAAARASARGVARLARRDRRFRGRTRDRVPADPRDRPCCGMRHDRYRDKASSQYRAFASRARTPNPLRCPLRDRKRNRPVRTGRLTARQ